MGKQQLPPFVVQVLTSEYLIEGTAPGDTNLYFPPPGEFHALVPLTGVQIQSTRSAEVPVRSCNQYMLTRKEAVVIIPRMDYTLLPLYSGWKNLTNAITGTFHLGHYWMTGKLMTGVGGFLKGDLPALDVRIGSMMPGLPWGEISAPFVLINNYFLHGWEIG